MRTQTQTKSPAQTRRESHNKRERNEEPILAMVKISKEEYEIFRKYKELTVILKEIETKVNEIKNKYVPHDKDKVILFYKDSPLYKLTKIKYTYYDWSKLTEREKRQLETLKEKVKSEGIKIQLTPV